MKHFLSYGKGSSFFRIGIALCFLVTTNGFSWAQSDSLIAYSASFKFQEGIFLSFTDVTYNNPVPKGRILADVDYGHSEFFENVLRKPKIVYLDKLGNQVVVPTNKIWGYSRNGFLYIRIDEGFYRITLMGSCCHFVAYKTYEVANNNYPYYNSYQYPYSSYPQPTTTQSEMRQYMLDFKTGNILEYSVAGLEVILMNDQELYDEYMLLSSKKKNQLKFMFIRKYNERNPLYLIKLK